MHIDLNRHRDVIEIVVTFSLVFIYAWLTVACVREVYAKRAKGKVPGKELKIGSQ